MDAAVYKRQSPDSAIDNIIRWATPAHCFQRTARSDVEVGGVIIRKGQRAGLYYGSANFDEHAFERPLEFDIPIRTWPSAETAPTMALAPTSRAWRSS